MKIIKENSKFKVTNKFSYNGFNGYSVETPVKFGDSAGSLNNLRKYLQDILSNKDIRVEFSGFSDVIRISANCSKEKLQDILNKYSETIRE